MLISRHVKRRCQLFHFCKLWHWPCVCMMNGCIFCSWVHIFCVVHVYVFRSLKNEFTYGLSRMTFVPHCTAMVVAHIKMEGKKWDLIFSLMNCLRDFLLTNTHVRPFFSLLTAGAHVRWRRHYYHYCFRRDDAWRINGTVCVCLCPENIYARLYFCATFAWFLG